MAKVIACIQVRMGSTRLPGKALLPIAGKNSIERILERLRLAKEIDQIVFVTGTNSENDPLIAEADRLGIAWYREPDEADLVARFLNACKKFGADAFVRVTGDCPLVDAGLVDRLVRIWRDVPHKYDAVTNVSPPTFPDGLDLDVIPVTTLERLDRDIPKGELHREWMTPYLYKKEHGFRIRNVPSERDLSSFRLTLDYPEDLAFLTKIFKHFGDRYFGLDETIAYLDQHPEVRDLVKHLVDTTMVQGPNMRSGVYKGLINRQTSDNDEER